MMEHALLNDESESGRSWGLGRRDVGVEEVWKARGEQRAISLMGADSPSTLSVKGEKGLSGPAPAGLTRPLFPRGPEGNPEHAGGRPRVSYCPGLQGWDPHCQESSENKGPCLATQVPTEGNCPVFAHAGAMAIGDLSKWS